MSHPENDLRHLLLEFAARRVGVSAVADWVAANTRGVHGNKSEFARLVGAIDLSLAELSEGHVDISTLRTEFASLANRYEASGVRLLKNAQTVVTGTRTRGIYSGPLLRAAVG